jgi:hypothetical protein
LGLVGSGSSQAGKDKPRHPPKSSANGAVLFA